MVKIATKSLALFVCALFAFALLSCGGGGGGGGGSASSGPWGGKTTITIPFTKGGTSRAGFSKGFNDLNWDAIELTVTQIANGKSEVVYEDMITAEKNITVEVITGSRIEATAIIKMKGDESDRTATGVIEKVEPGKNTLTVYVPYNYKLLNPFGYTFGGEEYNSRDGLNLPFFYQDGSGIRIVTKYIDTANYDNTYLPGIHHDITGDIELEAETSPLLLEQSGGNWYVACGDETLPATITIPAKVGDKTVYGIRDNCFQNRAELQTVIIQDGIQSIGNNAFDGCSNLTTINLPNSVTEINEKAFNECSSLKAITLPADLTTLGKEAFNKCAALEGTITVPNGVTVLKEAVFSHCYKLEGVVLHSEVTSIEAFALRKCRNIAELTIPSFVTTIGGYAFEECVSLETITLPGVETLSEFIFFRCSGLKTAYLPKVTTFGTSSFFECTDLTDIYFPTTVSLTVTTQGQGDRANLTGVKIHIPNTADADENAWYNSFSSNYLGTTLENFIKDQ